MLNFPKSNSPVAELFDVSHVLECAKIENRAKLLTALQARDKAQEMMAADTAIRSVNMVCLFVGELMLFEFSVDGRSRMVWNFGALDPKSPESIAQEFAAAGPFPIAHA